MAGSVTNRKVFAENETCHYRRKHGISKDPFAAIRHKDLSEPLYLVRHPLAVLTSLHPKFRGREGFYWDRKPKGQQVAPYALKRHYEALGEPIYRYEDLCEDPDGLQVEIGERFNLDYSRPWSDWPYGELTEYWRTSLGELRPIEPARLPEPRDDIPSDLRSAIQSLGYETA